VRSGNSRNQANQFPTVDVFSLHVRGGKKSKKRPGQRALDLDDRKLHPGATLMVNKATKNERGAPTAKEFGDVGCEGWRPDDRYINARKIGKIYRSGRN